MPVKKKETETKAIDVLKITQGEISFAILGTSPFYFNSMSFKAKQTLLLPRKKTAADRAQTLKHDPPAEFRDSMYRWMDDEHPTRLKVPAPAFKGAMGTAALVLPGTHKSEIGRLVWVTSEHVDFWGIPKLCMDVVRSADMAHTPDIRTRAKVAEWACLITIRFVKPNLAERAIANLMAAGGIVAGVGDYRQEKGKGSFGQFKLVNLDDPDFVRLQKTASIKAQDAALRDVRTYDEDTQELLDWYYEEILRRGRENEDQTRSRLEKEADKADRAANRERKAEEKAAREAAKAASASPGGRRGNGREVNA